MTLRLSETPRAVTDTDREIGELIRARREEVGVAQRRIAGVIGISHQQYQKYEAGESRVAAATLMRIAQALDTDVIALLPSGRRPQKRVKRVNDEAQAAQLQAAFERIASPRERKLVLDLALRLGALGAQSAPAAATKRKSRR